MVYGKLEGTLTSLLAMSNNQVAKFFIDLDVRRTASSPAIEARKFGDSVISNHPHRLSVLVFTGPKDAGLRAFREAGATMASPQSARRKTKASVQCDPPDNYDELLKMVMTYAGLLYVRFAGGCNLYQCMVMVHEVLKDKSVEARKLQYTALICRT